MGKEFVNRSEMTQIFLCNYMRIGVGEPAKRGVPLSQYLFRLYDL